MRKYLLPENGNFYKANLHCHSTISDGKLTPEEIKQAYLAEGYSVVAFTDHEVLIPHPELTDEHFLALNGYELSVSEPAPVGGTWKNALTCHLGFIAKSPEITRPVCFNKNYAVSGKASVPLVDYDRSVPDYVRTYNPECINEMLKKGREGGFYMIYNHPGWSMESAENYCHYRGMDAMEIVNYGCLVAGYEDCNPKVYDEMLFSCGKLSCVAADDNHNRIDDSCGGFVCIKAEKLEYRAVMDALEKQHFYASTGPKIHSLYYEDGKVYITCDNAVKITANHGIRQAQAAYPENGALTSAVFAFVPEQKYIRITVTDATGKQAFTNAYFAEDIID